MKDLIFILSVLITISLFQSCDKEPKRIDDFFAEFATVLKQGDTYHFKLDDGRILIPMEVDNFSGNEGDRVIIFWSFLNENSVKIMRISSVYTGEILTEGFPEKYISDPLKIISVWVENNYLNLILEIDYNNISHSIALFRDSQSSEINLYLAHSENNDPQGYPQTMYASFFLNSLRESSEISVPFKLFINTYEGVRQFDFTLFSYS